MTLTTRQDKCCCTGDREHETRQDKIHILGAGQDRIRAKTRQELVLEFGGIRTKHNNTTQQNTTELKTTRQDTQHSTAQHDTKQGETQDKTR